MKPIPRQKIVDAAMALAKKSPRVDSVKLRRELTLSGGDLRYNELGNEVSPDEYARVEALLRTYGANDEDIRNFHRSLGLRP